MFTINFSWRLLEGGLDWRKKKGTTQLKEKKKWEPNWKFDKTMKTKKLV